MILAQALSLARQYPPRSDDHGHDDESQRQPQYPAEEVEYFAAVTFNRAVDAYCASDDAACRRLADVAVEFAACLEGVDRGGLRSALVLKRESLQMLREGGVEA